jgi:WD40 repeat protein
VATNNVVVGNATANSSHINLLHASGESTQLREGRTLEGRTLQDAIQIDGSNSQVSQTVSGISILQSPVWITCQQKAMDSKKMEMTDAERSSSPNPTIEIKSRYSDVAKCTSDYMHELLKLREKTKSVLHEIKALQTAIEKQEENREELILRFQRISVDISLSPANKLQHLDAIKAERLVSDRVITQLKRKATELTSIQEKDAQELLLLESQSKVWEGKRRSFLQKFRDPFEPKGMGRNRLLQTLLGRQQGNIMSRPTLQPSIQSHLSATRKNLIYSRLSHAATINSHLTYPVYCLRFDRTGRYFITGADDYLIKVFYLGAGISCRNKNQSDGSRELRCNYGANLRGAVLVCSLRGHAGVINDIDVSADNCFLATASVDGDVRVWGLKDGCPVAVLRGHKGGANMVSWSTLTPYRLVSTGSDGYARQWDIREACLKRYGKIVGKREEYRLRLTTREQVVDDAERKNNHISHAPSENLLPPLPVREGAVVNAAALAPGRSQNIIAASPDRVVVPALPAGVPPLPGQNLAAAASQNGDGSINQAPGQFVANDLLDEGVKLLGRFKHGATGEDNAGPGTRSRRTAVKVICVARSPIGGHFTTGSDDGICRVWPDSEESKVEVVDRRKLENIFMQRKPLARKRTTRSVDDPLLQLMGHVSAITDLSYSSSGDRLLSASQKEGVIRIWSLSDKFAELTSNGTRIDERGIGQIVIRLTNPSASNQSQKSSRRRPGHSSQTETSKVNCDVAVWSHDDSRILTSQSVLLKQNGTDVQPGSQFLFLWDSLTGQCLMGISGAHAMQCPVVIPHPADSSLVCTAGADGYAKVWDWESGRCVFTHQNKVEFGPSSDVSDRNKVAGYLDGAFSPDGTTVVLTDDDGRITVLDCESSKTLSSTESPAWMQEQYFANDYYELFYDRYGYCIERGSERPPHLAPRGVHCNHSGSPWSDEIDEAFARGRLVGPMPLPEHTCRWRRKQIREKSGLIMQSKAASLGTRSGSGPMMIRRGIREFDALTTIMIQGSGHDDKLFELEATASGNQDGIDRQVAATENENGRAASSRNLSNNWQWRDFDDLIRDQGNPEEEEDLEDEEFEPTARRSSGRRLNGNEDDDENMDEDDSDEELDFEEDENFESPSRSTRRSREAASSGRRQRSQRRAAQRNERFVELGSEDEGLVEFMSLNNTPSGPYIRDYNMTGHFWRLSGSRRVKRGWLSRMESDTSYEGRKTYTPQLGDSIVYIPRAHYETLQEYPSLSPPWQRWPQSAAWPVVRCVVRGMRFRFPYEDYYRKGR